MRILCALCDIFLLNLPPFLPNQFNSYFPLQFSSEDTWLWEQKSWFCYVFFKILLNWNSKLMYMRRNQDFSQGVKGKFKISSARSLFFVCLLTFLSAIILQIRILISLFFFYVNNYKNPNESMYPFFQKLVKKIFSKIFR